MVRSDERLSLRAQRTATDTCLCIGLTGALLGTRYIAAHLFGVTPTDPLSFASGCALLGIVGLAASVIPALRAMRVDPNVVLRRV